MLRLIMRIRGYRQWDDMSWTYGQLGFPDRSGKPGRTVDQALSTACPDDPMRMALKFLLLGAGR